MGERRQFFYLGDHDDPGSYNAQLFQRLKPSLSLSIQSEVSSGEESESKTVTMGMICHACFYTTRLFTIPTNLLKLTLTPTSYHDLFYAHSSLNFLFCVLRKSVENLMSQIH